MAEAAEADRFAGGCAHTHSLSLSHTHSLSRTHALLLPEHVAVTAAWLLAMPGSVAERSAARGGGAGGTEQKSVRGGDGPPGSMEG